MIYFVVPKKRAAYTMANVIFCDRTTDKELSDSPINHKLLN